MGRLPFQPGPAEAVPRPTGGEWSTAFFAPGIPGQVRTLAGFGADIVAGGKFSAAGDVSAHALARWDGSDWHSLGTDDATITWSVLESSQGVIVSQNYTTPSGGTASRVIRWNGSGWDVLGGDFLARVLGEYHGALFAGGASGAYVWRGGAWERVAVDPNPARDGGIILRAFAVYRDELYAAGQFYLGKWDGVAFQRIPEADFIEIEALQVYQDHLVIAGQFDHFGDVPVNNIVWGDGGSWSPLGDGLTGGWPGYGETSAMAVYDGRLIVGGAFETAGGVESRYVAAWDGTAWSTMPTSGPRGSLPNTPILTLLVHDGLLYAGGSFSTAGDESAFGITSWNGRAWAPVSPAKGMGISGSVYAVTRYRGQTIVAGDFYRTGPIVTHSIAAWNGHRWFDLDGGVDGNVVAVTVWQDRLVAAGYFHHAGGVPAERIAIWDGRSWSALGGPMDFAILCLGTYGTELIAGGYFTSVGGVPASSIAAWDGTAWHPLGEGLDPGEYPGSAVSALATFDGRLIAGGNFTRAGTVPASHIAAWDGSTWSTLGTGTNGGGVAALLDHGGSLYVGGYFTQVGGVDAQTVARWDGAKWHALGSGLAGGKYGPYAEALCVFGDDVVVGGIFEQAGETAVAGLARWDGTEWSSFGPGVTADSWVRCLHADEDELVAGGDFTLVGNIPSTRIACYEAAPKGPRRDLLATSGGPLNLGVEGGRIRFALDEASHASLEVFDVAGRRVAVLLDSTIPAGSHEIRWSERSVSGSRVPAGVYFVRLRTDRGTSAARLVVLSSE